MGSYIVKRVLRSFVTLFLVCTIVFCLLRLMPVEGYFPNFDKMTPEQEKELAELQREILAAVHDYVKPGGTLVYSTCTIWRSENEENTRWFLECFPEYSLENEKQIFPSRETDGFYIAVLKRRAGGQ